MINKIVDKNSSEAILKNMSVSANAWYVFFCKTKITSLV